MPNTSLAGLVALLFSKKQTDVLVLFVVCNPFGKCHESLKVDVCKVREEHNHAVHA